MAISNRSVARGREAKIAGMRVIDALAEKLLQLRNESGEAFMLEEAKGRFHRASGTRQMRVLEALNEVGLRLARSGEDFQPTADLYFSLGGDKYITSESRDNQFVRAAHEAASQE